MREVRRSAFILSLCVLFLSYLSHYFVRPFHVFILALEGAGAVIDFLLMSRPHSSKYYCLIFQ
ncbi:hypothetical protein I7I50_11406 [Histoplasma capsulatum G186AR]|uniref:Uncharacterized protein n=1 Tax=Ajellomyces capsulatus TaxID=5037 RepID=A0A8H7ZAU4_AJECA|nr:hypothetical protein I7I52_02644 [Histoplasma capsulatum]QSS69946.1 hypothetical protein I7I50_11406 [Histoplasma capsulatum G186AR]